MWHKDKDFDQYHVETILGCHKSIHRGPKRGHRGSRRGPKVQIIATTRKNRSHQPLHQRITGRSSVLGARPRGSGVADLGSAETSGGAWIGVRW